MKAGTAVLGMLGALMAIHIGILAYGGITCAQLAHTYPERVRPFCQEVDGTLQKAVETYVAVILALLAPISRAD